MKQRIPFFLLNILLSTLSSFLPLSAKESTNSKNLKFNVNTQKTLPSPLQISNQLKKSLKKVRSSCVSLYAEGYGSGVIISPDGLVLTAAHMMRGIKKPNDISITLEDGRNLKAQLLGFNRESDIALLKIITPLKKNLPFCQLAKTSAKTGDFCFTMAHPDGILKGRPAQVRIGRIKSHSTLNNKPRFLFSDCNIQPGDSGGPLFSLDGQLIGLDSSAASIIEFNIFSTIDQFYKDRKKFLNKKCWGDIKKAPDGPLFFKIKLSQKNLEQLRNEFMHRLNIQYPPTIDFINSLKNDKGKVTINQKAITSHMPLANIAFSRNQPLCLGLQDPALTKKLPPITPPIQAIAIYSKDKENKQQVVALGIPIDQHHILTKNNILKKTKKLFIKSAKSYFPCIKEASDKKWDISLLRVPSKILLPVKDWKKCMASTPIQAGDLLIAKNHKGHLTWNIATDKKRPITQKRGIGPLKDKSIISQYRAPYPLAIRTALPLYAKDVGSPVFNEKGKFVGIFIARFSRTIGLIIPAHELYEQTQKMLNKKTSPTTYQFLIPAQRTTEKEGGVTQSNQVRKRKSNFCNSK